MSRDKQVAAQGRDGRKNHQRRTGNDPQGPTGRAGGTYTPSAATTEGETMTVSRYDDTTWAVYDDEGKVLAHGFFTSQAAHDWIEAE